MTNIEVHTNREVVPLTEGEEHQVSLRLQAATLHALQLYPYLGMVLYSMVRIPSPGLGTLGVDKHWRMYYDPQVVLEWRVTELATALLHEAGHCLRGHAQRFVAMKQDPSTHPLHNIATDTLINTHLTEEGLPLPGEPWTLAVLKKNLGVTANLNMSSETVFYLILEKMEELCTCDSSQPNEGADSNQGASGEGGGGDQCDSTPSGEGGTSDGGNSADNDNADGGCGGHTHDKGPQCPVHSQAPDCGSVVDGIPRSYEVPNTGDLVGVSESRADNIRDRTAVAIKEHSRTRGEVPGAWSRWAEQHLNPVVDWRKELASLVRRSVSNVAGLRDYTYSRPSRRSSAMRNMNSTVVLPAMRKPPPPTIAIVFDTSGSMSDDMLTWGISEISGILTSASSSKIRPTLISCDSRAGKAQRIRSVEEMSLTGGGGTDMRIGIDAALSTPGPSPDIVIVITDGSTPWPDTAPPRTKVLIALTDEEGRHGIPTWAKTVLIKRDTAT